MQGVAKQALTHPHNSVSRQQAVNQAFSHRMTDDRQMQNSTCDKRPCIASSFMAFRIAKDGFSEPKRPCFTSETTVMKKRDAKAKNRKKAYGSFCPHSDTRQIHATAFACKCPYQTDKTRSLPHAGSGNTGKKHRNASFLSPKRFSFSKIITYFAYITPTDIITCRKRKS